MATSGASWQRDRAGLLEREWVCAEVGLGFARHDGFNGCLYVAH